MNLREVLLHYHVLAYIKILSYYVDAVQSGVVTQACPGRGQYGSQLNATHSQPAAILLCDAVIFPCDVAWSKCAEFACDALVVALLCVAFVVLFANAMLLCDAVVVALL